MKIGKKKEDKAALYLKVMILTERDDSHTRMINVHPRSGTCFPLVL